MFLPGSALRRMVVFVALGLFLPSAAAVAGQLAIYEENDTFGLDTPSDRHYTQGLRIDYSWETDQPRFVYKWFSSMWFYKDETIRITPTVGIAQNMYTPEIITDPVYNPDDRPFGAWLYASAKTMVTDDSGLYEWQDTYELSLGVVGPSALGDEIQSWFHDLIGDPDDPTWVNQIPDSPAILLGFTRKLSRWPTFSQPKNWPRHIIPAMAVRLGNVFTDVGMGVTLLWGYRAPVDFAAGAINPSIAGDEEPGRFRAYAHAGIDGRVVFYNCFLDGTAFRDSPSIERNTLVTDFKGGVTVSWHWFRFSFTQVWRSPEIKSRSNFQNFGAIQLGFGSNLQ